MNNAKQIIETCASVLKLHYVKVGLEETICQAQIEKPTYIDFLAQVLQNEVHGRQKREQQRRMALAKLPPRHDLDEYDFSYSSGINRQEMKESPTTVRIPISAFMSACRKNMVRRETPLAFAMRM